MTFQEFINELEHLVPPGDRYKPHKYIALLAVIELLDKGYVIQNRIFYDTRFRSSFTHIFGRFAGDADSCRPHTPFFHLKSCAFWRLQPAAEREDALAALESVGSPSDLVDNVDHAYLDADVFQWLSDSRTRKDIEGLITRILEERKHMDTHFYIDYAPPYEVCCVLRVLSSDLPLSSDEISRLMDNEYGIQPDAYRSEWPRRLFDIGLAEQIRDGVLKYQLTQRGLRLQAIQSVDPDFARDLLHYLHFSGYSGNPADRKYLWSYRRCCKHIWSSGHLIANAELAAALQEEMRNEFPSLNFNARQGARFDKTAAGRVYDWVRSLKPSPIAEGAKQLRPRFISRAELAVLALDDLYRARQYTYGDPVILDDSLMNDVAGVFFLDRNCCADLLRSAADIYPCVKLADTLAGPSINLTAPFTVDDL